MQNVLVASDFDETLLIDGALVPGTLEAIRDFRAGGGLFGVCSGRDGASLAGALQQAGLDCDFLICLNGASVSVGGETIATHTLPANYARCLPLLRECCVFFAITAGTERVLWRGERYAEIWGEASMQTYLDGVTMGCTVRESHDQLCRPAEQISCRLPNEAAAWQLRDELKKLGLDAYPNGTYTDIVPRGVDKAQGVETVRAHFNIPAERTVTIGDGENDIPMLRRFCGFAMAHASERVRRQAGFTTHSVGEALRRIQGEEFL